MEYVGSYVKKALLKKSKGRVVGSVQHTVLTTALPGVAAVILGTTTITTSVKESGSVSSVELIPMEREE